MHARICIIGNGDFARKVHYPSLRSFEDVKISGICAFDADKLNHTARKFNISEKNIFVAQSRQDYQKILSDLRPDGVYVIGQPEQMFDIWIWCLENRFNLFIEKPMGLTIHQASSLAYLAEKNNCITQVSFQRRSAPLLQKMHQACLKRGQVTHALVEFCKYDINPMLGPRDRMLDDYTHVIDTARYICGGEIIKVESRCRRILVPDINWIGATLYFDNGSVCYAIGNWTSGRRIFRTNIHSPGICAEVEIEKEAHLYAEGDYHGERFNTIDIAGSNEYYVYGGFLKKNREFIDSIISGVQKTTSPFSDALKTMEISETILAQSIIEDINAIS